MISGYFAVECACSALARSPSTHNEGKNISTGKSSLAGGLTTFVQMLLHTVENPFNPDLNTYPRTPDT